MSVKSRKRLLREIKDLEFRHAFVEEHLRHRIAVMIRNTRESQNMDQGTLAKKVGTGQSRISQVEDVKYGKMSIQSLLKICKALDVALFIDIIPFSKFLKATDNLSPGRLKALTYTDSNEQIRLQNWANEESMNSIGYKDNAVCKKQGLVQMKQNVFSDASFKTSPTSVSPVTTGRARLFNSTSLQNGSLQLKAEAPTKENKNEPFASWRK